MNICPCQGFRLKRLLCLCSLPRTTSLWSVLVFPLLFANKVPIPYLWKVSYSCCRSALRTVSLKRLVKLWCVQDQEGAQETAEWYGTEPVVITGIAHDVMLDTAWERAAEALQLWLDGQAL